MNRGIAIGKRLGLMGGKQGINGLAMNVAGLMFLLLLPEDHEIMLCFATG